MPVFCCLYFSIFCRIALANDSKSCAVNDYAKVDCGYPGIDEKLCEAKSCCWFPSSVSGIPWCFNAASTVITHPPAVISAEFKKLKEIANITYSKVLPCIQTAWMMAGKETSDWVFPDDAEYHFEEILNRTAKFRTSPVHEYAGYEGPWIENIFISTYMNKPLSFWRGFIPIFVQWIDTQILRGRHFDNINHELNQVLRPNVLYLAISQGDVGLGKIGTGHPNILALAAGGYGHVPIPLIRGEIPWVPPPTIFEHDIGFFGNVKQASRPDILEQIKTAAAAFNLTYKQGYGKYGPTDASIVPLNIFVFIFPTRG